MGTLERKIKRKNEKKEEDIIKQMYGKQPKGKCPNCNKKSLFYTNEKGETFCVRCDKVVKIK